MMFSECIFIIKWFIAAAFFTIIALWPITSPILFSCFLYLRMSKITVYLIHEVYSARIHMPFLGNARTRNCPCFVLSILLTHLPTGVGCNTRSILMWGVYRPIQKLARLPCHRYSTDLPSFSTMTTVLSQSWNSQDQSPSSVINEETLDPWSVVRNQRDSRSMRNVLINQWRRCQPYGTIFLIAI